MRRRSFFLLEVMIAVLLIGVFAYVSLQGLYHFIHQQRTILDELEYARLVDLKRMDVIVAHWNKVEEFKKKEYLAGPIQSQIGSRSPILNENQKYEICSCEQQGGAYYLLSIKEDRGKRLAPLQKEPQKKKKREEEREKKKEIIYHYFIKKDRGNNTSAISQFNTIRPRQSPGVEAITRGGSIEKIQPPLAIAQPRELSRWPDSIELMGNSTRAL